MHGETVKIRIVMFSVSEIRPRPPSKRHKGRILLNAALNNFSNEVRFSRVFSIEIRNTIQGTFEIYGRNT